MSTICASTFNKTTSKVFWITGTQMAVPETKLAALKEEGIDNPEHLFEFTKNNLGSVFESLRKSPVKVGDNKVVTVDPHVISVKLKKRIAVAAEATRYYAQVGRDITSTSMHWNTLTNFDIQWNVLKDIKKQDDPDVPNLTKNIIII